MTSRYAGEVIAAFNRAIFTGGNSLEAVPGLLKRIIRESLWQEYPEGGTGEIVQFKSFPQFLARGCNIKEPRTLMNLCRDDPEAIDLLDRVLIGRQGERTDLVDNVNEVNGVGRPDGNTEAYALRRLRNTRPELHARVIAKEISAHRAMVEAGFRRPTIQIPADDTAKIAEALRRHLSRPEIEALIAALQD